MCVSQVKVLLSNPLWLRPWSAYFRALQTALESPDYRTISQNYHIPVNRVGVYSTQLKSGEYWVYVLCQVAAMSNVTPVWDRVGLNSGTSNFLASLKSVFIPGWGQMGKSHYGEGIATLVGEAALVGGGIACYKALGLHSMFGHLEIIMKEDGTFTPVEMGARSSGFICSHTVWKASGHDYLGDYVRESGEGATIESAMAQAMVRVFQSTANRLGEPYSLPRRSY